MTFLENVRNAGVVGAGGAGFPTHVKLDATAEFILLNGAECEPLLRVDQQIMDIYADEIIQGFHSAAQQVSAKKAFLCVKGKHKALIVRLRERIKQLGLAETMEVKELPDVYPAGDEQILVYEVTGRIVPETGIPLQVGCVVINSETALNIYYAQQAKTVTTTWVTLAGDIPERMTIEVPIGTPVLDVLRCSGIDDFTDYAVIDGGPMMGPVMEHLNGFVTKASKGYIILNREHPLIVKKNTTVTQGRRINRATCEQCRMCTDLCPRYLIGHDLEPHRMMSVLTYGMENTSAGNSARLCCMCNLCELFACPVGLHPKMANQYLTTKMLERNDQYTPVKRTYRSREARAYRQVPSKRLILRLGLKKFDCDAPVISKCIQCDTVGIMLKQHVGAPAVPIVKEGDCVQEGQMVAAVPDGSLGAPVHSSINGTVTSIDQDVIMIGKR